MLERKRRATKKGSTQSAIESEISPEQIPFAYDEHAPRIYADGVRLLGSKFGVALVLTQLELGPSLEARARHVGTLHMSPEHADALIDALIARRDTPIPE